MHVQKERKLGELWLTRTEKNDTAIQEALKPIYQQDKAQNYLIEVFLSGEACHHSLSCDPDKAG